MPRPIPLDLARLEAAAAEFGTPLQLYDEAGLRSNVRGLLGAFRRHFPGFRQFYAVKALPNPAILRMLLSEGCGLDCSSVAELWVARELGVRGDDIMFTSNYTSREDLRTAYEQGVIMNLDDASLVDALVAEVGRCPDLISFRLNPGVGRTDSETSSNVLGGPAAKFGVPPSQIVDAYRAARAAGASRFGIHMMTGSCVLEDGYWSESVAILIDTVAQVHRELGIRFEFLNIGGGLGIPYEPGRAPVDVDRVAALIAETVARKAREHALPAPLPALFMENGRYVTGPFGWLVSRCEAAKRTSETYFGLDACMANLMRPGMYGAYHHISVPKHETFEESTAAVCGKKEEGGGGGGGGGGRGGGEGGEGGGVERLEANVVGTLCENNDWFARHRSLPAATAVGDLFVIHDTGAHAHSMGFQYNGKLRAPEVLLRADGRLELIRARETVPDLFANTRMPRDLGPPLRIDGRRLEAPATAVAAATEVVLARRWPVWVAAAAFAGLASGLVLARSR